MRRLFWPLGLAAVLLSPFVAHAQSAAPLTLDQALELAISRSYAISAAQRELEASEGALEQAGTRRNPELSTGVEDSRSATRTTTVTVGLPLELGGKRAARITASELTREVARVELGQTRAQVRAATIAAYFALLVAQERAKLAADSATLAATASQVVAKRVLAGKVSPVDATRAQVDEANAQLELAEAQAQLTTNRHALASLWSDAEPIFPAAVTGEISDVPERPPLTSLVDQLDKTPALLLASAEVRRRRALVDVERSRAVPDLMVSVGAKRSNELGLTQAVVGVSMPIPLFDRNQGAVYEASKRAQKAQDEYQAARVRTLSELQGASMQLSVARTSVQLLQSSILPAAQQAYEAASKGFEAGKFGFLDVLDAQRSLLQARSRYLNALSNAYQAATAIDRLLGR